MSADNGKVVEMPDPKGSRPQPTTNPAHTHVQAMFTSGSMLFFPINVSDAQKAVDEWKAGSPAISLRPTDGQAFHIAASQVLFLRQVNAETAASMLAEQNEMNRKRQEQADMQAAAQKASLAARGMIVPGS